MNPITIPNHARKAALMAKDGLSLMGRHAAPQFGIGLGMTSAYGTPGTAIAPANAGVVVTDARVRDAKQAAPPRGVR